MRRPAVLLVCLTALLAVPAGARAAGLAVSPAPGTPDASPGTQVSILGVAPGRILGVSARGAVSGAHHGGLRRYSAGRGASFVPDAPFDAGERVQVQLRLRGERAREWTFTVAQPVATPPLLTLTSEQPDKLEHLVSEPALSPPLLTVRKPGATGSGSIFLTPLPSPVVHPGSTTTITIAPVGPGGPMIADAHGRLVWFRQLTPPEVAANLRIQSYHGRPVLTWWQGGVTVAAYGQGVGVIADSSYRTIATVHAGNGYEADLHDFSLTGDGDALLSVYAPVLVHVPGTAAGKQTLLLDGIVQEVDIATGLVVWEWHSLGHIALAESHATPANSAYYDAYHVNAIQPLAHGRVLVSERDTSAVYDIARAGGRIVWRLGGKASDFKLGRGARFWFQHDATMLAGNRVSLFDDEAGPPQKAPSSRGLVLRLDKRRMRATVVRSYRRPGQTSAQSEGSLQELPNGDVFAGFGAQPWFSQFTAAGRLLFDARLPLDDGSYRVYRFPWTATPRSAPKLALRAGSAADTVDVYASWNGATGVKSWQVLAGSAPGALQNVAGASSTGFETRIAAPSGSSLYAVRALGAGGRVLATSATVAAP